METQGYGNPRFIGLGLEMWMPQAMDFASAEEGAYGFTCVNSLNGFCKQGRHA